MIIPALPTSTRLLLGAGFVVALVVCIGPALGQVSLEELRELNSMFESIFRW
jgi:hypothetical protein